MMYIDDIRRANLAELADRFGGVAGLSKILERSESQVSQWIRGAIHSATGKRRGMRTETARWVDAATGMPDGWLDTNHEPQVPGAAEAAATYRLPARHARPLVQELIELAEQIDDAGLHRLIGAASMLASNRLLLKAKAKSSA